MQIGVDVLDKVPTPAAGLVEGIVTTGVCWLAPSSPPSESVRIKATDFYIQTVKHC